MTPITVSIPSFVSTEAFTTVYQSFYSDIIKLSTLYQRGTDIMQKSQKLTIQEQEEEKKNFEEARSLAWNEFIYHNK